MEQYEAESTTSGSSREGSTRQHHSNIRHSTQDLDQQMSEFKEPSPSAHMSRLTTKLLTGVDGILEEDSDEQNFEIKSLKQKLDLLQDLLN